MNAAQRQKATAVSTAIEYLYNLRPLARTSHDCHRSFQVDARYVDMSFAFDATHTGKFLDQLTEELALLLADASARPSTAIIIVPTPLYMHLRSNSHDERRTKKYVLDTMFNLRIDRTLSVLAIIEPVINMYPENKLGANVIVSI